MTTGIEQRDDNSKQGTKGSKATTTFSSGGLKIRIEIFELSFTALCLHFDQRAVEEAKMTYLEANNLNPESHLLIYEIALD